MLPASEPPPVTTEPSPSAFTALASALSVSGSLKCAKPTGDSGANVGVGFPFGGETEHRGFMTVAGIDPVSGDDDLPVRSQIQPQAFSGPVGCENGQAGGAEIGVELSARQITGYAERVEHRPRPKSGAAIELLPSPILTILFMARGSPGFLL